MQLLFDLLELPHQVELGLWAAQVQHTVISQPTTLCDHFELDWCREGLGLRREDPG